MDKVYKSFKEANAARLQDNLESEWFVQHGCIWTTAYVEWETGYDDKTMTAHNMVMPNCAGSAKHLCDLHNKAFRAKSLASDGLRPGVN